MGNHEELARPCADDALRDLRGPMGVFRVGKRGEQLQWSGVYADMNAKREKGKLCAITLGLLTVLLAGCGVSTGAGTTTIDPPRAPLGLPTPPPVTVPTPGTR